MLKKSLYRVTFSDQDTIYEIYVRKLCESEIFGFLEIEDFVFGENTSLVVDPSEERLKVEFNSVKRTYIPLHAIFRIDEVNEHGTAKIRDKSQNHNKISLFPVPTKHKE